MKYDAFINFTKKHRRVIFFLVVAAFVVPEVSVYFHKPARGADIFGYFAAGQDVLNQQPLYRYSSPGKNNTWPPFFSIFITPLAVIKNCVGVPLTKELWYGFNFLALIGAIQIIIYLLYNKKPTFIRSSFFDFTSHPVFVPIVLVFPALVNNFFMLQINVFILFLVSLGFLMHYKEKPLLSGLFFGLAGAIKAYPGLFALYFLFRKQWKTSIGIMAFGIVFTLSPILLYGFQGYVALMKEWLSISFSQPFVVGYTAFNNHSLYAFWERTLAHQLHCTGPASQMIKLFTYCSILALTAIVAAIMARYPYKRDNAILAGIEFSIICILMMLFPPIAWRHYWVLLFPAAASVYFCIRNYPALLSPSVVTLFTSYLLLTYIPYIFSKSPLRRFLESYSSNTFAALVLVVILLILYSRINRINREKATSIDHHSVNGLSPEAANGLLIRR